MKGFKICRIDHKGRLVSCFNDGRDIIYKKNKWTKRPEDCGPLAVFDTLDHALKFLEFVHHIFSPDRVIFECKYKPSKDNLLWFTSWFTNSKIIKITKVPEGTIFADEVKITKMCRYVQP